MANRVRTRGALSGANRSRDRRRGVTSIAEAWSHPERIQILGDGRKAVSPLVVRSIARSSLLHDFRGRSVQGIFVEPPDGFH